MRVDQAFLRAGFEIVDAKNDKEKKLLTFDVRVPLQGMIPMRWKQTVEHILLTTDALEERHKLTWKIDISKRFYVKHGSVRYLWRIVVNGDISGCQRAIVQAAISSMSVGAEVNEVRLVGQENLTPDLANGRVRGAYGRGEEDRASGVVAAALHGNGGVNYRQMPKNDEGIL